jgi:hypothetical protein
LESKPTTVLGSSFENVISSYISRLYALKASCETLTRLKRIFKGVSATGKATIALRRYKGNSYRAYLRVRPYKYRG